MAVVVARIEHHSRWGRWTLIRARPAVPLAPFVVEYQAYRETSGRRVLRRETPTTVYPVILNLGAPFAVRGAEGGWVSPGPSFAAGLHDSTVLVASEGRACCLQVDLTPPGARRVFGLDLDAIANRVLPLEDLLGPAGRALVEGLAAAPSWAARFARLDAFLLGGSRPLPPAVAWAWDRLAASGGRLPVGPPAGAAAAVSQCDADQYLGFA